MGRLIYESLENSLQNPRLLPKRKLNMNFNDLKDWFQGIEPENKSLSSTMLVVAQIVVASQEQPEIVKQAKDIIEKGYKNG